VSGKHGRASAAAKDGFRASFWAAWARDFKTILAGCLVQRVILQESDMKSIFTCTLV
jgi:hypothetical protein